MVVGNACQPVFAPAIGAGPRLVVSEIIPGVSAFAVILAHRTPLSLAKIGAPFLPRFRWITGFVESIAFVPHFLNSTSHSWQDSEPEGSIQASISPARIFFPRAWPGRRTLPSFERLGSLTFVLRHLLVRDQAQEMRDAVQARPLLVVRADDVPGRILACRSLRASCRAPGSSRTSARYDSRSIGLSFHCRSGSSMRASNRRSCSSWPTSSQILIRMMPPSTM